MYSNEELADIRSLISGKRKFSESEISKITNELGNKEIYRHQYPLIGLIAINEDLWNKVSNDKIAENYGMFAFFPHSYDMFYGNETLPSIEDITQSRNMGVIIKNDEKKIVIKTYQYSLAQSDINNVDETKIAPIAADIGIGPRQYESLDGYLTEEFIEGEKFVVACKTLTNEQIYSYGEDFGKLLKTLHEKNIYYNDILLCDDFGRTHLLLSNQGIKLIDFGVSIDVSKHPIYNDEQAFNYGRTQPLSEWFLSSNPSHEQIKQFIEENKNELSVISKREIFSRDMYFLQTGIDFASSRFNINLQPFAQGFTKTYF